MSLKPHSLEWYERLAKLQRGYYYPWRSTLPPFNGEDVYLDMLYSLLRPDAVVLDAGCGHGELTLNVAPHCKEIVAYDRIEEYIQMANQTAQERGISNATFILGNSSREFNEGQVRIPTDRNDFTLLISRRGPINWLEDVRRVARPGAVVLELNPDLAPAPPWNDRLPAVLRQPEPDPNWPMRASVERELAAGRLRMHSCWHFDVPEFFDDPAQLYNRLTWGFTPEEVPAYQELRPLLEEIWRDFAGPEGVTLRHRRLLWKAIVD